MSKPAAADECLHIDSFIIDFDSHVYGNVNSSGQIDPAASVGAGDVAEISARVMKFRMRCRTCETPMQWVGTKKDAVMEVFSVSEPVATQAAVTVSDDGYVLSVPFGPAGNVVPACEGQGFTFAHLACDAVPRTIQ